MAWRLWAKGVWGQRWVLLLFPAFLLFLVASVMTLTLPLPRPPFHVDQRSSRSLSSTGRLRSRSPAAELLPAAVSPPPPAGAHRQASDAWRPATKQPKDRRRAAARRGNKHKRKKTAGASRHPNRRPRFPEFADNNRGPKRRVRPGGGSQAAKQSAQSRVGRRSPDAAAAPDSQAGRQDGRTNRRSDKPRQQPGGSGAVGKQQLAPDRPLADLNERHDPRTAGSTLEWRTPLSQPSGGLACASFQEERRPSNRRHLRVSAAPWLSEDDVRKMLLLAGAQVVSKAKLPAHGQVLQVALAPLQQGGDGRAESHGERCQRGFCSLVKRTDDWFEVFAFHLDRVLGLNRSLPAVLRTFRSQVLPYRYISGVPRPAVWWDPDIQHLASRDNDQNSVPLSWVRYQKLLRSRCGIDTGLWAEPCVGIHHSEWGRLALFDFLLQVNDRLDRYCCGFSPDPTEPCVENMLQAKCGSSQDLQLVHILVRKADPSRLVFIDNSGRPHQSIDNLDFRLVEGVSEFPERAASVLQSGCLESLLLRSLYTDREFWESRGGADGLRPLIRSVERRGKVLLQHIRDKNLQLRRDQ